MKKQLSIIASGFIATLLLTGCSHKISIDPSLDEIRQTNVENKINANVGYYISEFNKNKKVNTPGGGGDSVDYTPYKDTESALNTVLSKIFNRVYSLKTLNDKDYIKLKNIKYIFVPTINTTSSSGSAFTWPPTNFTFELKCQATNNDNKIIWEETIYSEGYASFSEFKNNFSLSAQRATEKAFKSMLIKLKQTDKFKTDKGL